MIIENQHILCYNSHMKREAMFYEKTANSITCNLCHNHCTLHNGQMGLCRNKVNEDNTLYASNYGSIITMGMDPIEKKPLYHFHPGSSILSVAQAGCNLHCPFCQNSEISQHEISNTQHLSPAELRNVMNNYNYSQIAFTYTEPLMWYEYIYDFAQENRDIDIVIVSNGCIENAPIDAMSPLISAANIDIKSFNSDYYSNVLGGDLNNVKYSVESLYSSNTHIELTFLLIEGDNDNIEEFSNIIDFISHISPDIPLHISRYFPSFKYSQSPTSMDKLIEFYNIANRVLHYVYLGNVPDSKYTSTHCPQCGHLLIKRDIYSLSLNGLKGAQCARCGFQTNIIL